MRLSPRSWLNERPPWLPTGFSLRLESPKLGLGRDWTTEASLFCRHQTVWHYFSNQDLDLARFDPVQHWVESELATRFHDDPCLEQPDREWRDEEFFGA